MGSVSPVLPIGFPRRFRWLLKAELSDVTSWLRCMCCRRLPGILPVLAGMPGLRPSGSGPSPSLSIRGAPPPFFSDSQLRAAGRLMGRLWRTNHASLRVHVLIVQTSRVEAQRCRDQQSLLRWSNTARRRRENGGIERQSRHPVVSGADGSWVSWSGMRAGPSPCLYCSPHCDGTSPPPVHVAGDIWACDLPHA